MIQKASYIPHDNDQNSIGFYEREFYCLSNFSSFRVWWKNIEFDTSEHAYHWTRFLNGTSAKGLNPSTIQQKIRGARSAHDAFILAQEFKQLQNPQWDKVKVPTMLEIIAAKGNQHPYIRHKLLQSESTYLIEDSFRDDFWGHGIDGKGKNVLGKLWMKYRSTLLLDQL